MKPNSNRGGKRIPGEGKKIGRPKLAPEAVEVPDKDFASRVLSRIGTEGWRDYADITKVTNAEDLALHYVTQANGENQYNRLIDRKYGKSVQTVNHVHDKPIEMNLHVSLSDEIRKARERSA